MSEKEFEDLLKTLSNLTERKVIKWTGDPNEGYSMAMNKVVIRLKRHTKLGTVLSILNQDSKTVAVVSAAPFAVSEGIEFFKSSIPSYIYELIIRQERKTDEVLDNLFNDLMRLAESQKPTE